MVIHTSCTQIHTRERWDGRENGRECPVLHVMYSVFVKWTQISTHRRCKFYVLSELRFQPTDIFKYYFSNEQHSLVFAAHCHVGIELSPEAGFWAGKKCGWYPDIRVCVTLIQVCITICFLHLCAVKCVVVVMNDMWMWWSAWWSCSSRFVLMSLLFIILWN